MDKFDRIYAMHKLLAGRRTPLSSEQLQQELECSRATVNRTLELLRDHLNAPIIYDREHNGYVYARHGESWELPGLWLNAREVVALMAGMKFLGDSGQGLLSELVRPFRLRLEEILRQKQMGAGELIRRIRILSTNARPQGDYFHLVADATVRRKRITVTYHGRTSDAATERQLSPQRLVHYRNNWYLDAWCHLREGLRTFSLDRFERARLDNQAAQDVDELTLDRTLAASYGIFSGVPTRQARLRFDAHAARWVGAEVWHPDQSGRHLENGEYELTVPYAQAEELIGEILRHGPAVEVLQPRELRDEVARRLQRAAAQYAVAAGTG